MNNKLFLEIIVFFIEYWPLTIGALCQLVFLLLPIMLKNWDDDLINVFTYAAFQILLALFIFVAFPLWFGLFFVGTNKFIFIIIGIFLASFLRALKIIPLEFTYPVTKTLEPIKKIDFIEFHTPQRLHILSEIKYSSPYALNRIALIKERLIRRQTERAEETIK